MQEVSEIKKYARKNQVPIMKDDGLDFICNYIREHNVKRILEIGTAIGYSAIQFAKVNPDITVVTIEREIDKVIRAKQNFHDNGLEERITVLNEDALMLENLPGEFDLIFIDAAKAQYIKFFEKFKVNLAPDGVIVSDNLSFHGMVEDFSLTKSKDTIRMLKKIKKYVEFLKNNPDYTTEFFTVGDGISVTRKN